ncbi:glucosamine-6-phosphate deaminase [Enterococcus hulanensis]|uniref:glucosamine-6-phosphate deaminase n=1 Tax=Enterococcus hulanensis TaxID=2559929 RepID=UPI0028928D94|nr:glucosamine-6-phosphate deaminase [Enterococcus hulanensis]MDT2661692.1 glucosamine-6-phosphate deaminase [Enterococcus hulanensis]
MKVIIKDSFEEMSKTATEIFLGTLQQDKRVNISTTAGATPELMYKMIIDQLDDSKYDNVHYYTFDGSSEMGDNKRTIDHLNDALFDHINIDESNIHELRPDNIDEIQEILTNSGDLDLMVIGMGEDGHFCGNMPYATDFLKPIYTFSADKSMPWYDTILWMVNNEEENIPKKMVTMGAPTLMKAKHLVLIVNGEKKAEAVKKFMNSEVTIEFPASVLKLHPNFTVILDKDAANLL